MCQAWAELASLGQHNLASNNLVAAADGGDPRQDPESASIGVSHDIDNGASAVITGREITVDDVNGAMWQRLGQLGAGRSQYTGISLPALVCLLFFRNA